MSSCSSNIEDYQIGKLIGKGSSGKVYSATNLKSGEIVAIKVIEKNNKQVENKSDVEAKIVRIRREVEIHHRLRHLNIVELINFFEDSNFVYLIMQFCEFGDLSYFLKINHPLENDLIRYLFRQIINGILYLHSNGIMHRDISMSNILISKDSVGNILCKLSDFGIATVVRKENQHNAAFPTTNPVDTFKQTLCGTPDFIAPEVVMHNPYDLSRDIWSLGCILYSMYAGKSPFHAQNIHESMRLAILKDLELDNSLFPPQVSQLLQLMLNKNPKERPSIQQLLSHPFVDLPQNENCRNLCNSDSGLISTLNCKPSLQKIPNLEGLNFNNDTQFRNRRNILGESTKVNIATHFTADSLPITTTFIGEKTKQHFSKVSNSFRAQPKIEKLSPIKSFNLPEFSYKSKNINLNVTKNFWVKLLTRRGETLDISPDGHIIYQSISRNRTTGSNNCSKGSSKLLSYYQMPDDMVRKYNYAYKYLNPSISS
ncbi:MAG: Serine/threonine-protein kinase plk4 [Marteilia pararefringens]